MEKIVVPFEVKEFDSSDEFFNFKGYASTFGNEDLGGDRVMKGAFIESLKEAQVFPLLWQHQHSEPVGVFTAREDVKGLFIDGKMPKGDSFVRDRVMPQLKIGSIKKMSIGYGIREKGYKYNGDVRELNSLKLYETSLVTFPMNPEAGITALKALDFNELDPEDIRAIEKALKSGVKFSDKTAKKLIQAMKTAGMLRDEQDGHRDGEELLSKLDEILNTFKE